MLKFALTAALVGLATPALALEPIIDNDRVTVWNTTNTLPPAEHDYVSISLGNYGTADPGRKGSTPGVPGTQMIVVELKDKVVPPIENKSGYPAAFPRANAEKLFENERVIGWSYHWAKGETSPMHFHDKDVVVVYENPAELKSTTPDGKSVTTFEKSGTVNYNPRGRIHTETLMNASGSAVMIELK